MLQHDPHGENAIANRHIDQVFDLYENDYEHYGQEDENYDDGYISEEIKVDGSMRRKGAFVV